jgi:DNA repair exonuclease SbcCD ATPase subunit
MTGSQNAFVLLTFEEEFEKLYEKTIVPTLEEQGYEVNKADSTDTQRAILEDIIKGITDADLIIADLTGENPNVFYELGVAHGLGVPTVLIAQDVTELPFDLSAYNTIEYSPMHYEIEKFEDELSRIARNSDEIDFGNPVSDYGDIETEDISKTDTSESDKDEETTEEGEIEKGVLDYNAEVEDEMSEFEDIIDEISDRTESLTSEIMNHIQRSQDVSNDPKKINQLAKDIGKTLSDYSNFVEERNEKIDEKLKFLMDGIVTFINASDASEKEQRQALKELEEALDEFISETNGTVENIREMREEASELTGLNRELNRSVSKLEDTLSDLENTLRESVTKAERFKSLIENKLEEN